MISEGRTLPKLNREEVVWKSPQGFLTLLMVLLQSEDLNSLARLLGLTGPYEMLEKVEALAGYNRQNRNLRCNRSTRGMEDEVFRV